MGVTVEELKKPVQPIAQRLCKEGCGFAMMDVLSIGLLFLHDKDANAVGALRALLVNAPDEIHPGDILAAYQDEIAAQSKASKKKRSRKKRTPTKDG